MSKPPEDITFTPAARRLWALIPQPMQRRLLDNVWCSTCRHVTTMVDYRGEVKQGDMILTGTCAVCGATVARLVESE